VSRAVQAVLLILLGGQCVRVVVSDLHVYYVKPSMGPALLVSGVVLLALGALTLRDGLREVRHEGLTPGTSGGGDHGHDHGPRGPLAAWALLLPVAAILVVPAAPLGSFTANRVDPVAPQVAADRLFPPLTGDPADLSMGEFVSRAVWDEGQTLAGARVRLVGFASPAEGGGWDLARLGLACCAADAYVVKVSPVGAPSVPADTWVEVIGTWQPGGQSQMQGAIPLLAVESVTPTEQPDNPYDG
jgi:uncharacterized repeat protein (TIGR03943 family)